MARFYEYFCNKLGGQFFAKDVLTIIETYTSARGRPNDELSDTIITIFNRSLQNSNLVGGADFDCVMRKGKTQILTDIKTTNSNSRGQVYNRTSISKSRGGHWDNLGLPLYLFPLEWPYSILKNKGDATLWFKVESIESNSFDINRDGVSSNIPAFFNNRGQTTV